MKKLIIARENVNDSHLPSHLHPVIKQIYATRRVVDAQELDNGVATLHDYKLFKDIDKEVHYSSMRSRRKATF